MKHPPATKNNEITKNNVKNKKYTEGPGIYEKTENHEENKNTL